MKKHLEIVMLRLDDLKPYERNAKKHPQEQIEQIKQSIIESGFNDPIAVWSAENIIVEGHGRYLALKELGYEECECIRLDHLTPEQRKKYIIAHNKLTMNTGFDDGILRLEFEDIEAEGLDLDGMGFDGWEIDHILNPVTDDDLQDFFEDKVQKDKQPKIITCPHCGEDIEV